MTDINFFIDGTAVSAKPGETILQVAARYGIYIPAICYSDRFSSPVGACRICIVVIEQLPEEELRTDLTGHHPVSTGKCSRPMPSCVMKPKAGTYVWTNTDALKQARADIVKRWDRYHPLQCGVCDASGECELQDANLEFNITEGLEQDFDNLPQKTIFKDWPIVNNDTNLCIQCKKCVKVCDDVMNVKALALVKRDGGYFEIDTVNGLPLDCEFCNQCIDTCPTGALESKFFMYKAKSWEVDHVRSHCFFCPAGCELELNVKNNNILRVTSHLPSFNDGNLCNLGSFAYDLNTSGRLNGAFAGGKEISLNAALDKAYLSLKNIVDKYGKDSIEIICDSSISSESMASAKWFAELIGASLIFPDASGAVKLHNSLASFGLLKKHSYDDIRNSDTILVLGSDITNSVPFLDWIITRSKRSKKNAGELILANWRESKLDSLKPIRLKYRFGNETELLLFLIKKIAEKNSADLSAIESMPDYNLLIEKTGIDEESIAAAASQIISGTLSIMVDNHLLEKDGISNLLSILALTANKSSESVSFWPISKKANIMSAVNISAGQNYSTNEEFKKKLMEKKLHAVIYIGNDIERSIPASEIAELKNIELMIQLSTHDISSLKVKETILLPVKTDYETSSHFVNLEGNLIGVQKAVDQNNNSILSVQKIIEMLAKRFDTKMGNIKLYIDDKVTAKKDSHYKYSDDKSIGFKNYPYKLVMKEDRFRSDVSTSYGSGPTIARENGYAEISEDIAALLDIKTGDMIKLMSIVAEIKTSALVSNQLHGNIVAVPEGFIDINPMLLFSARTLYEPININKVGEKNE